MKKEKIKRHLPNIFFLGGILILAIIAFSFSKDFIRANKINVEIKGLENELTMLQQKNIELNKLLKYFDSEAYAEKKARTELGLKKPGESVVIVPKSTVEESISENSTVSEDDSRFKKWWNYFFGD